MPLLYNIEQIAKIIDGTVYGEVEKSEILHISVDTRSIIFPENTLFFAIKTKKNNGHRFVDDAINRGLKCVVVTKKISRGTHIVVKDTLVALQKLAVYHRSSKNIRTIGITGSNGKTIVKEWVANLLGSQFNICKNPKSFNSQIGVPLSVWNLDKNHEIGVFEAGISEAGEMDNLERIIQPEIGVFTFLGDAHDFYFESKQQKLLEKLQLFKNCKIIIAPDHQSEVVEAVSQLSVNHFFWGTSDDAQLKVIYSENHITLYFQHQTWTWQHPPKENFMLENLLTALCVGLVLGMDLKNAAEKLINLQTPNIRIQQLQGISENQLFIDYYNSDLESLTAFLSFTQSQNQGEKKTLIWSDFAENVAELEQKLTQVNTIFKHYEIAELIVIGTQISAFRTVFSMPIVCYESVDDFLESHPLYNWKNRQILIKGAKRFNFENIVKKLQFKIHQTRLEINLKHIIDNFQIIRSRLNPSTKLMAMVKAFSYGSGAVQIAKTLQNNSVDMLGVAYLDEALQLRNAGISVPIMVLNSDLEDLDLYTENNVQPIIFSKNSLLKIAAYQGDLPLNIHLEIDTGMHRLGFFPEDILNDLDLILNHPKIKISSVLSHFPSSDSEQDDAFSKNQLNKFLNTCQQIELVLGYKVIKHIANTAAILRFPEAQCDMVRLGLGLYGLNPNGNQDDLKPVGTFKSYITQIKKISANEGVGYGRKNFSDKERTIAIVAVGYADGFDRRFSQGIGKFLINNQLAPVVGNVCMDMTMCDVTGIQCEEGDEVIIFNEQLTVMELARNLNTIPYEILTNVNDRVSRIYYM